MIVLPHVYPTVVHMLAAAAERAPDREALVLGTKRLTYREYWADDPQFDSTNLSLIAADDPCPLVTVEMLRQTFRFALKEMSRSE